jgi:Amt family ammonium transporter
MIGVAAAGVATFGIALITWLIIKAFMGIRVSPEEELEGLDLGEHGNLAYPDFQTVSVGGAHMT